MPTILSLEQALALPYATQRFVQLGWRVIRIESPPEKGGGIPVTPTVTLALISATLTSILIISLPTSERKQ